MANRQAAQDFILQYIEKLFQDKHGENLVPGSQPMAQTNADIYRAMFASMSDADFDHWMQQLEHGEIRLAVVAPNLSQSRLTVENNLKIADELGHNFFERIWIDEGGDMPKYLSPKSYLVIDLPVRRQAQLLVKKISIPEDNKTVDDLSGQPTGKSKGSKISYPETQVMAALNLDNSLIEMIKYRGGDEKGFDALNTSISRTGGVSLQSIEKLGTQVKATQTLNILLTAMHLSPVGLLT